jgi:hypothetical protein
MRGFRVPVLRLTMKHTGRHWSLNREFRPACLSARMHDSGEIQLANTDTHNSHDLVIAYICISKSHLFRPMVYSQSSFLQFLGNIDTKRAFAKVPISERD